MYEGSAICWEATDSGAKNATVQIVTITEEIKAAEMEIVMIVNWNDLGMQKASLFSRYLYIERT